MHRAQLERAVEQALDLLANAGHHYQHAAGPIRRRLHQSMFERFWLADDEVIDIPAVAQITEADEATSQSSWTF